MELFSQLKKRLVLYGVSLAVLLLLLLASLWTVIGTGAFLTGENDWQGLAGDYRIGTIDYTVDINGSDYLGQTGQATSKFYELAVPIQGGVRLFDPTVSSLDLLNAEFNEGKTLVRVRVVNRSSSKVQVNASFTMVGDAAIHVLPLPLEFTESTAKSLIGRQVVLDALKLSAYYNPPYSESQETQYLAALEKAYNEYYPSAVVNDFPIGFINGAVPLASAPADGQIIRDETAAYYYEDIFLLVWCEYSQAYDSAYISAGSDSVIPQAKFSAQFTVGQMD